MECTRCNTPNDDVRKFCRGCGAPLGRFCDRCGTVNLYDDKFCGVCGFPLVASLKQDMDSTSAASNSFLGTPRQYSVEEIVEVLALRKKMKIGQKRSTALSQDEIDGLFG